MASRETRNEIAIRTACEAGEIPRAASLALEAFGPEIFGYLVLRAQSRPDADDIWQDFCLRLCKGLPGFQWRASLRTWLYKVARNACRQHYRSPQNRPSRRRSLGDVPLSRLAQSIRESTLPHQRSEVKGLVARIRTSLRPQDQELLTLHVDRGLPFGDIAEIFAAGMGPLSEAERRRRAAALRKRYERIKDRIRRMAESEKR